MPLSWADSLQQGETITQQGNGQGAVACMSCHGPRGEGNAAGGFPRLAGLPADYLGHQLRSYRDGTRQSPIMQPFALALSDEDIQSVSAYYASLEGPNLPTAYHAADPEDAAEWLAERGGWGNTIPACNQCHGPNGQGVGNNFPPLAGQHASYLASQLNAWRNGTRRNDPNGLMQGIAERLSEKQIELIAAYYATLPEHLPMQTAAGQKEAP
ncbi:c-type cytochrome [Halomonas shantousis]